jgi:membrane associated rhomboid family serine protease
VGNIFGGLSDLDVAAVGHVTAIIVAAAVGSLLLWQLRKRQHRPLRADQADVGVG